MPGNIWVVAEHWQGSPTDAAFEALALGRELADGLGVALEAVVLGSDTGGLAAALGAADRIVAVDHPALSDPIGDVAARTIAALAAERRPEVVLVPITNLGWDLIGLLPARIGCPMVNFVQDASVVDGRIEAASLVYGGKMSTRVAVPAGPAVLAVLPGTRPAEAGRITGPPPVDRVAMDVDPGLIEFCGYREPEAGDVDITRQDVLVAIGRGIGGQGNVE
ncbi:MAG: electron transfer flavoprotein subunit alpha/FixB family protein, partial [Actinobacteria bacterium]|nr:electron transfer flavoprotein subunit alpha/FixB family protein [Actinomycetota bacterium]